MIAAVTTSTTTVRAADWPALEECSIFLSRPVRLLASRGQETCVLHQLPVQDFGLGHPLGIFLAAHEGLVERPILHEFLPLGGVAHLLEEIDVEADDVPRDAGGHEDATQHH